MVTINAYNDHISRFVVFLMEYCIPYNTPQDMGLVYLNWCRKNRVTPDEPQDVILLVRSRDYFIVPLGAQWILKCSSPTFIDNPVIAVDIDLEVVNSS